VEINPISFRYEKKKQNKPVGNTFGTYTTPTTTTLSHWWKFVQKVGFPFCHRFGSDISYLLQIKSDDTKFAKTFIPRKNIANKERKKERKKWYKVLIIENQRCVYTSPKFFGCQMG
jgi:hypothetical protein